MREAWMMPTEIFCGYFDGSEFGDLTVSPERTRKIYEINLFLKDGKSTYSDGVEYKIKKGYVLLGKPGEVCNSLLPFETKFLKFPADGMLAHRISAMPTYFPLQNSFEIEQLLDEIIALHTAKEACQLALYGKLMLFLSLLSENARANQKSTSPVAEAVLRAKQYIDQHYAENLLLAEIAASVSLSATYFHTIFCEACGVTPHEYLLDRRISAARELLCATALPIAEIAERCGFSNQQYFGTVFKKRMGISPSGCRKEYRQSYLI
jgi:AraC-like DNA-binding protein